MWEKKRLFDVIERYFFHSEKSRSDNPIISEAAKRMCDIEIWEMWELTQYL